MTRTQEELKVAKSRGDKKIQVCRWCSLHFPTTLSYSKHHCDQDGKQAYEAKCEEREEKIQDIKINPYHMCQERNFEKEISKLRFQNDQKELKAKYKTRKKDIPDDKIKPIRKCKICKEYYKLKIQDVLKIRFELQDPNDKKVRFCHDCSIYYVLSSLMHICHHIIPKGYEMESFVVKQGLPSCLKNDTMNINTKIIQKGNTVLNIINNWVISTQQSKILATRLMNIYLMEICESWDPKNITNFLLDQNTILTAISLCSKREIVSSKSKDESINPRLYSVFKSHFDQRFTLPCSDNLSKIHKAVAHQLIVNFDNYIDTTFYKRHLQWIDLLLREMLTIEGPLLEDDPLKHVKKLSKRLNYKLKSLIKDYSWLEEEKKDELEKLRVEIDGFFDQKVTKYLRLRSDSDKSQYSKKRVKEVMPCSKQIIQDILKGIDRLFRPCVNLKRLQDSNDQKYKSASTSNRYLLPWMHFISTNLKQEKSEYSLFPLADFIPGHINLDRTMWVILYKQLNGLKHLDEHTKNSIDWKSYFFNLDSNFWTKSGRAKSRTLRYISTDGVAASFIFERAVLKKKSIPDSKKKKKEKLNLPILTDEQLQGKTKIIALDEGRRHFFDAVIRTLPNRNDLAEEKHDFEYNKKKDRDKSITLGSSEWREMKGTNNIRYLQKQLLNRNEQVKIAQGLLTSGKTCNKEKFSLHLTSLQNYIPVLSNYYSKRIFRRHRLTAYSKTRQAWDKSIFEKLELFTEEDYKSTIIIVGDASFAHNSPGHASLPTKSLYKNLAKKVDVYYQDEFRTSKLCSCCQRTVVPVIHKKSCDQMQQEQVKLDKKVADIKNHQPDYIIKPCFISPTRKPFGLRRCPQPGCRTLWNRDVNAAINIMNLFIHERIGANCVPNYLKPEYRFPQNENDANDWRSYYQRSKDETKIDVEIDLDGDDEELDV